MDQRNCSSLFFFYSSPFLDIRLSSEAERTDSEIVVTWSTRSLPPDQEVGAVSVVEYGQLVDGQVRLTQQARGKATKFVDGGHKQATQFIHRVCIEYATDQTIQVD